MRVYASALQLCAELCKEKDLRTHFPLSCAQWLRLLSHRDYGVSGALRCFDLLN